MSGFPGRSVLFTRHPRIPTAHSSRRKSNSGFVFDDLTLRITRRRTSGPYVSGIRGVVVL